MASVFPDTMQIHETGDTWPVLARNGTYIQGINQGMFGPRGMRRARGSSRPRHLNREKIPFPTNSLNAQKGPSKWDCEVYIPSNLRDRPGHRLGNHTTPRLSLLLPAFALFLLALAAVGALISSFPHLEVLRVSCTLGVYFLLPNQLRRFARLHEERLFHAVGRRPPA